MKGALRSYSGTAVLVPLPLVLNSPRPRGHFQEPQRAQFRCLAPGYIRNDSTIDRESACASNFSAGKASYAEVLIGIS